MRTVAAAIALSLLVGSAPLLLLSVIWAGTLLAFVVNPDLWEHKTIDSLAYLLPRLLGFLAVLWYFSRPAVKLLIAGAAPAVPKLRWLLALLAALSLGLSELENLSDPKRIFPVGFTAMCIPFILYTLLPSALPDVKRMV